MLIQRLIFVRRWHRLVAQRLLLGEVHHHHRLLIRVVDAVMWGNLVVTAVSVRWRHAPKVVGVHAEKMMYFLLLHVRHHQRHQVRLRMVVTRLHHQLVFIHAVRDAILENHVVMHA